MLNFVACSPETIRVEVEIMNSNRAFNLMSNDKEELTEQDILDDMNESSKLGAERVLLQVDNEYIGVMDWIMENPNDGYPWLGLLAIHKQFQRKGYARQALARYCELMRERGVSSFRIGVLVDNEPAQQFWTRMGFREVKNGKMGEKPIIIYEKAL
ncbi:GNAT family N-acetyltransferase [Paenibacillus tuaregi]|uniref:GNAT family N-acetyltransferase n=1 Tax=Paenibacillus tuaregi TaxID=1816681 RepID=UPI000838465E|nr:GNAT family N-acetyltransferase [Paenibacillus tuaregi]